MGRRLENRERNEVVDNRKGSLADSNELSLDSRGEGCPPGRCRESAPLVIAPAVHAGLVIAMMLYGIVAAKPMSVHRARCVAFQGKHRPCYRAEQRR
jgi:hypothetical protein